MDRDSGGPGGPSEYRVVTRKHLFDKMQQQDLPRFADKLEFLQNYILSCEEYSEEQIKILKHNFSYLKSQFKRRWTQAHKELSRFLSSNEEWLQGTFAIPRISRHFLSGRPAKSFEDSSERVKRRKTEDIRTFVNKNMLVHAVQVSLHNSGKRIASTILKDITNSPTRARKYKEAYMSQQQRKLTPPLTPLSALSIFVEADLSRRQYEIIRSTNKRHYPSYKVLQQAKKDCYPIKESYRVTETCAEIELQHLLDHTARRLVTYVKDVLETLPREELTKLQLIYKWGCDGSQQDRFKQKMQNDATDSNIFQSCLVPLQLICGTKLIWQNPTPSSPRYCRPIRIRFIKETVDIINSEINYIEKSISKLQSSKFVLEEITYSVNHVMTLTMVDGKVCNAATSTTSTMKCYICGATSSQFNDLTIKKDVDIDALSFGLSVLHARIRLFESILHLAYKIPVKKWQLRATKDKEIVKKNKAEIQAKFREQTGLIIDVPKAGFGNTNDGNTSRRFFSHPELAAEITGVDFQFIFRIKVILEVISSGHKVDLKKFAEYTYDTAELYVGLYPWHPMTPTLHKILIHGATVIEKALLPIGLLSEEAAEARNKHFRQYRQNFARKFSRENCNLDIINRLLLSSDPLITSIRPKPKKRSVVFSKEALELLISAEPSVDNNDSESSEESAGEAEEGGSDGESWFSSSS